MLHEFADRFQLCPYLRLAARLIFQDTHDFTFFKYHFVNRLSRPENVQPLVRIPAIGLAALILNINAHIPDVHHTFVAYHRRCLLSGKNKNTAAKYNQQKD
jgi:hypothetical protein